jgi:hypothetical protein
LRNRGAGDRMDAGPDRRRDENSLRVTNLSEDVTEGDLQVGISGRYGQHEGCIAVSQQAVREEWRRLLRHASMYRAHEYACIHWAINHLEVIALHHVHDGYDEEYPCP